MKNNNEPIQPSTPIVEEQREEKRGKTVSRSIYQKLAEENKKLKADIKTLVVGSIPDSILLKHKYKLEYEKEQAMNEALRDYAKKYFEEHPEEDISKNYNNNEDRN